ncbi:helix-turn-helix domain-containing protein [Pseudoflavonifractor sp. P01025]|uniref:helix-turn-helix domain-containing protein n=1 Tax=Flintibacter porci TaxID=3342383 RepID=UPI0035B68C4B
MSCWPVRSTTRAATLPLCWTPLEVRLAQFILLNTAGHLFTLQLTDCADALNTSYRHLLRIMKQLCALNILSKEHNCYYIQDRDALERVSSGELLIYE